MPTKRIPLDYATRIAQARAPVQKVLPGSAPSRTAAGASTLTPYEEIQAKIRQAWVTRPGLSAADALTLLAETDPDFPAVWERYRASLRTAMPVVSPPVTKAQPSATQQLQALVEASVATGESPHAGHAFTIMAHRNPELYEAYKREQAGVRPGTVEKSAAVETLTAKVAILKARGVSHSEAWGQVLTAEPALVESYYAARPHLRTDPLHQRQG
jgi:hypothetical protein